MLSAEQITSLDAFISNYSESELAWISGYISGKIAGTSTANRTSSSNLKAKKITVAYGTETGNSKKVALDLAAFLKQKGQPVKIVGLDTYKASDLLKEEYFFTVISTQGEGEPPVGAKVFYEQIHQNSYSIPNLKFSVLALGDTSYPLYCKAGEDVHVRLSTLGAASVVPLRKCDVDFSEDANAWFQQVWQSLQNDTRDAVPAEATVSTKTVSKSSGKKFYKGTVNANILMNDIGSNLHNYHIEISANEPIEYETGDSLAVVPVNRKDTVDSIIAITGIDPRQVVSLSKVSDTISTVLLHHLNIQYLLTSTVKKYAAIVGVDIPETRMDLLELLRIYPVKDANQFLEILKVLTPIAPRLYSIASSPIAHGDTVHLTVERNFFQVDNHVREGLCSNWIADFSVGTEFVFYIHPNRSFRLPAPDKNLILIGPGTGIAPMRAFVAERDALGASGKNWLFFAAEKFSTDFLYQTEWQQWVQTGVLTNITVAFPMEDPSRKTLVDRILEEGSTIWQWLSEGAYLYLAGEKEPMGKQVETALLSIFQQHGQIDATAAEQYLKDLKKEDRYHKDLY